METLEVSLGERSYPIYISQGAMSNSALFASHIKAKKVVVVTNDTLKPLFESKIADALAGFDVAYTTIPDGEAY